MNPRDVVELLQELIRIPSVNPDNSSDPTALGEERLAKSLAEWLSGFGADVEHEEVLTQRPNLIARFVPRDGRPRILLGPHLDTVGVEGMAIDPFAGEISRGRIWGRGASDTKASMAAMLSAWLEQREIMQDLPVAVDFVAFMGEESGQWGSKQFAAKYAADYQFAVVGEPTRLNVVHLTKGSLWATLRSTGRAAHSSMPQLGENAIFKLIRALDRLDSALEPVLVKDIHPVLGVSTMNVGLIRGGTRPNIVPEWAEAEIDIRTTPALACSGGALRCLSEAIDSHALPIEIVNPHENPPMETAVDHPLVKLLLGCADDIVATGAPWFSDAAHLSAAGIPSVCVGPGSIDQAHTVDEFIELADLHAGEEFFRRFLSGLRSLDPLRS